MVLKCDTRYLILQNRSPVLATDCLGSLNFLSDHNKQKRDPVRPVIHCRYKAIRTLLPEQVDSWQLIVGSVNKDIASNVPTKAYISQSFIGAAVDPKLSTKLCWKQAVL